MLSKSKTLDCGHAVMCFFWAFHNILTDTNDVHREDRTLDVLPINGDQEPEPVCRIAVCEAVAQVQSNVEFSARNSLYERRRGQVAVLGRVFCKWLAIHADGDGSTGKAVGAHLGRCVVVSVAAVVRWVRLKS